MDPAGHATVNFDRVLVALIGRSDRHGRLLWSMPKGHIEPGETRNQTAIREVREETGVSARVLSELGDINYWFVSENKRINKTVHHHILHHNSGELNADDPEVTEVAWVKFSQLRHRLAYSDERRLMDRARSILPALAAREIKRANISEHNPDKVASTHPKPSQLSSRKPNAVRQGRRTRPQRTRRRK